MANQITVKETQITIGDLLKITQTIKEKDKERQQVFEGMVMAIRGREPNKTFRVRKIGADNVGVEKIFSVYTPSIAKVEVKKSFPARRAKLYHLRNKK